MKEEKRRGEKRREEERRGEERYFLQSRVLILS
jgi:hypothetical protein